MFEKYAFRLSRLFLLIFLGWLGTAAGSTVNFSPTDYRVNEFDGSLVLTVTLDRSDDPDPGTKVTVQYRTVSGTATGGSDFAIQDSSTSPPIPPNTLPLIFAPGETSKEIVVSIINDTALENPESFTVVLFNAVTDNPATRRVTIANGTATVTIYDNDSTAATIGFSQPTFSINENPQNNGGVSSVPLTVTRSGTPQQLAQQVSVNYATQPVTAVEGVDYQGTAGVLVFNSGEASKTIMVPIFDDGVAEANETFLVNLSPSFGGISTATVTIVDDDGSAVSFSSSSYSVAENAGSATITLSRTGNLNTSATVSVVTVAGTATAGQDYTTVSQDVSFTAGQTTKSFQVPIQDDALVEGNEFFKISLSARQNSGVVIGSTPTTTVNIIDDEAANTVEFAGTDFSVNENDPTGLATVTVRLNRNGDRSQTVTVRYFTSTGSATPNQDYTPIGEAENRTLTFGPNETVKTFTVAIANDTQTENTETVGMVLSSPTNAFLGAASTATLSIVDDDSAGAVQFSNGTYAVSENAGSVTLTVLLNRTGNSSAAVSVDYMTFAGSAGTDRFVPTSGTISFPAGSSVATITVPIKNDTVIQPPQTFSVALSNPINASLGLPSSASITIQDDDGINSVEFDAPEYGAVEIQGAVQVRIRATRGGDPNQVLSVQIALGAPGDTAQNPADYQNPSSTTVTFPAGVSVQSVTIPITNNPAAQGVKAFSISLTNPGAFTSVGSQSSARVTIFDNSGPNTVQFLTTAQRFREGDQAAVAITVVRFGAFDVNGTIARYTTELRSGDTAQENVNFTPTSGEIRFAPLVANLNGTTVVVDNEHVKTIIIPIPNNTLIQGDVTFHLTLLSSDVAQLGSISTTKITITDDDLGNVVQFSSATYSVLESAGNAILTVNLIPSGDASRASSVNFIATPITAFGGFDFSPVSGTLIFAPGETTKTILVPILNDSINEAPETFRVTLTDPGAGTLIGNPGTAITTIIDDDIQSIVQFGPSNYTVSEAGDAITVFVLANRQGNPNSPLTANYQTFPGTAVADADFASASGTVTFGPGETQKPITIQILNDNLIEGTENFFIVLSNPGTGVGIGAASTATIDIADDDSPTATIGFSAASFDVNEGAGFANLTITRSGGLGVAATINFATSDGTAKAGLHYQQTTGSVTFGVGEVSKTIQIPIIDDTTANPTLNFTVTLTSPSGTGFIGGQSSATVNIIDNDATTFRFNPTDYTVDEGSGTVTLTVEALRVGNPSDVITVDFITSDGTALAGLKYQRTSGRLTFDAGVTTRTITVPIIDGTSKEGTQYFFVNLSNPLGTTDGAAPKIGSGKATVTIFDNDATTFQFSAATYTFNNSSGSANLTVNLARLSNPNGTFTVNYATSNLTAQAGTDYTAASGTLTFGPGETKQTITIALIPEPTGTPTRQFLVTLSNPSAGADLGSISSATVTINNFDLRTKLRNVSTRAPVEQGDNVMIAGFIVEGENNRQVVLRGLGPSLTALGVADAVQDPTLQLMDANGNQVAFNDNYTTNSPSDLQTLTDSGFIPGDPREAALVAVLGSGPHTVILRGKTNGIGLIEAYDLSSTTTGRLANISTRAKVKENDNGALIAGFIVSSPENEPGTAQTVVIRALGPSLTGAGVNGALADPTLDVYRGSQKIFSNDNWKTQSGAGAGSRTDIEATGLKPSNDKDSALLLTLDPGSYTAVVRGKNNVTGIGLVEVYNISQ